jgi:hypothetical protein
LRHRGGPSDSWVIYYAGDLDAGKAGRENGDYPYIRDSHGRDGVNVILCDGHTGWASQKAFLCSFSRGKDEFHFPAFTYDAQS